MATPKLGLPELASAAANQTLANQTFDKLDQLVQLRVLDKDLATPPGSPSDGAAYIVAAGATGAWSGKAGQIAYWRTATNGWAFLVPANGWLVWVDDEARRYSREDSAWVLQASASAGVETVVAGSGIAVDASDPTNPVVSATVKQPIIIACSDETTALTAGAGKVTFRMPYAFTLTGVRASLTTAQTSGSILAVDINEAGASILSTKLTVDNGEKTSTTAAAAAVISDTSLADDAEITIDIDQIGDGTAKGLKVTLIGVPA